jgi:hypothetical protein
MTEDLGQAISDAAQKPKKAVGDQGSMEQQPLQDMIAADKYLHAKDGAAKNHMGMRFVKLVPPGAG